jgi:2-amino-4-hydroxy-6-hydroxymethyldihydropteridine diphosphokinase
VVADHLAWLLLGSNIRPEVNLPRAAASIGRQETLLAVSSVWQSPPSDGSDQPDYLNAAILIRTAKSPAEIYADVIAPIEQSLGRVRTADKFAPRTMDIDLAMYDELVEDSSGRRLPHPDILNRAYAALPLAEISPDKIHPETGEPLRVIADRLRDGAIRRREEILLLPALPAGRPVKR